MSDTLVEAVVAFLKTCLCAAVQEQANPPLHCCYRLAGEVAMDSSIYTDMCCEGLAYVSVNDSWVSSDSFPEQDIIRQATARCAPPSIGMELKIGIIRCAPLGTDTQPATCTEWEAAAIQAIADNKSLWRASCCFRNGYQSVDPQMEGMSLVMGRQTANSPQGGCVERSQLLQVQFPIDCYGC